jgi:hypothetical protein
MRKIVIGWFALAFAIVVAGVYSAFTYPCENQVDARERKYHAAVVVDKIGDTSCGKYGRCEDYLYVTLQLDDGGYNKVRINRQGYESAYIGGKISMARQYTDPICVNHASQTKEFAWYLICLLLATLGLCLVLFIIACLLQVED